MGLGVVSLGTFQKREQAGPPFVAGSADNGLSVSPAGTIVLGNDVGEAGSPAALFSDREIITEDALFNLFSLILNSIQTGITTTLNGQSIQVTGGNNTIPDIQVNTGDNGSASFLAVGGDGAQALLSAIAGAFGSATLNLQTDADRIQITPSGFGHIIFRVGALDVWQINTATFFTQIGPTLVADNGATLQVTGTLTRRLFTQSQGAGTYNVDRDLDSDKLFRNSAAANLALPNMAAANARPGFVLRATCFNVAGITITAFVGQTIRFGSLATSAGGTLSSTDVGAYVKIVNIDSNTWVTETFNGAWVLT